MMQSPLSSRGMSSLMPRSVTPAGTISQIDRGLSSLPHEVLERGRTSRAFLAEAETASALTIVHDEVCRVLNRRTCVAPMRPRRSSRLH